jgi:hypothetical protein
MSAASFETAFNQQFFAGADKVDVSRTGPTKARGFTWTVTYIHKSVGADQLPIANPTPNTNLQSLTGEGVNLAYVENVKGNAILGSFQLSFNGFTTSEMKYDLSPADMAEKLNQLESIRPSKVAVTRTALVSDHPTFNSSQTDGYVWTITFTSNVWADPTAHKEGTHIEGNWNGPPAKWSDTWETGYSKAWGKNVGDMPPLGCHTGSLTASQGTSIGQPVCTVREYVKGTHPLSGTFKVGFDTRACQSTDSDQCRVGHKAVVSSGVVAHNAVPTAALSGGDGTSMEEVLEAMPNIGDVSVSRSLVNKTNGAYTWSITFLRDDPVYCEQKDTAYQFCNSPGDVPPLTTAWTQGKVYASGQDILLGDNTSMYVYDATNLAGKRQPDTANICAAANMCYPKASIPASGVLLDGHVLRGRFTTFKVTDDAGAVSTILRWNSSTTDIKSRLEEQMTGRTVEVDRVVIGKYGVMEWLVRFTKNPGETPPGAGDIKPIIASPGVTGKLINGASIDFAATTIETQKGSTGLGGSFTVDYVSPGGPRSVSFQETAARLENKLDEMTTIADVSVIREMYPSATSGGWGESRANDGDEGGYVWKVRFLRNTGTYAGMTFPPGSGDVNSITVNTAGMIGTGMMVKVSQITAGSSPLSGTFTLGMLDKTSRAMDHSVDSVVLKQELDAIRAIEDVSTTREDRTGLKLVDGTKVAEVTVRRDQGYATVSNVAITRHLSPGDLVRIGGGNSDGAAGSTDLAGTNGDTSVGSVSVTPASPLMTTSTDLSSVLTAGQQLRVSGDAYTLSRTGVEVQTITVSSSSEIATSASSAMYQLSILHNGKLHEPTACLEYHSTAAEVETAINAVLGANSVVVSRKRLTVGHGYVYKVYFEGVNGNVNELKATTTSNNYGAGILNAKPSGCTPVDAVPGGAVAVATVIEGGRVEVQKLTLAVDNGNVSVSNYFKLQYTSGATTESTSCIKWGDTAENVQAAIQSLNVYDNDAASKKVVSPAQAAQHRLPKSRSCL